MNNTVELIGHYGGDQSHALSAWTSTDRNLNQEKIDRIPKLLKYLAENKHETPFEKSYLHFLVRCDTASHIHFLKHRIGVSVNGESSRYKELQEPTGYIPEDWPVATRYLLASYYENSAKVYHEVLATLEKHGLDRKRAKESARFFLPYSNQLTLDVGMNFRSFMHFLELRNEEHAQLEIRQIAQNMLQLVKDIPENPFKYSLEAFGW